VRLSTEKVKTGKKRKRRKRRRRRKKPMLHIAKIPPSVLPLPPSPQFLKVDKRQKVTYPS
jgi:hypothetical protein